MGSADLTLIQEQPDDLAAALLERKGEPERVFYEAGVLLDADDFNAETRYLRGRLARALGALFGHGTVAGLKVTLNPLATAGEVEIKVAPGLALDRLGRLIEVRREQCLRLDRWLAWRGKLAAEQESVAAELLTALRTVAGGPQFVLDVWLRFAVCVHGMTPAFASGPYNATDYTVPSRLADAYELTLDLARLDTSTADKTPIAPGTSLNDLAARRSPLPTASGDAADQWLDAHVFNAWEQPDPLAGDRLRPLQEHRQAADWDKLLLARIEVPLIDAALPPRLEPARSAELSVNNALRPLALNPMRWAGIVRTGL